MGALTIRQIKQLRSGGKHLRCQRLDTWGFWSADGLTCGGSCVGPPEAMWFGPAGGPGGGGSWRERFSMAMAGGGG